MMSYVGNTITPLGGRIGQLGKVGWYMEGRASVLAGREAPYEFSGSTILNYNQDNHSSVLTGNEGWKAYSAVVGATFQTSCNFFFYLGIGYGYKQYIKEFNVYNDDTGERTGTYWAKEEDESVEGVQMDGGIILRYKALIFSGGLSSINLGNRTWTLGFGVAF
jgi:hypothetical protein